MKSRLTDPLPAEIAIAISQQINQRYAAHLRDLEAVCQVLPVGIMNADIFLVHSRENDIALAVIRAFCDGCCFDAISEADDLADLQANAELDARATEMMSGAVEAALAIERETAL